MCCDDACTREAEDCSAPVAAAAPLAGEVSKEQAIKWLVSGTPAEKAQAASALYAEYSRAGAVRVSQARVRGGVPSVKPEYVKGPLRCCDSSCVVVNRVCENTIAMDHVAVEELKKGGPTPSNAQLTQWLVSGTPAEKDEAASLLYTKSEREGKVSRQCVR